MLDFCKMEDKVGHRLLRKGGGRIIVLNVNCDSDVDFNGSSKTQRKK